MHHPDPVLTASLYSNRGLDDVVAQVVAPFRHALAAEAPGAWGLWMVRYSRCGEHLKLRLHGPAGAEETAARLLAEAAERHFASLPDPEPGAARVSRADAPPIDEDDRREEDYPDRTLRLTRYLRSYVNLGWKGHLDDDRYVGLMTAAFAAGAARILDAVDAAGGRFPASGRQTVLLRAVVDGLAAAGLDGAGKAAFLAFHRDWLVRWNVADEEREAAAAAQFDVRLGAMARTVEQVGALARARWEAGPADDAWSAAVAALVAYTEGFRGDPAYNVDPFTDEPSFPPLFKVFHSLGNALGVGMLDEAFTHHLVLRAAAPAPALSAEGAA
ncbi:MAG TPA: lantibiotic dehydratase C-terminal domain-containing protein [Longimicrobium sp.]|nr:lantibiotic dehydratase C-terminal domain-containing protein [Longimicrobium sp.]